VSELPRIVAAEDAVERQFEVKDGAPGSLLARLRDHAREAQKGKTYDLPVPGFQGELVLRFAPLDIATVERLAAKASSTSSGVSETLDAMVRACVGVYGREADGHLEPLEDEQGPVRIEHRLAVILGMTEPGSDTLTAREVVLRLFGGNAFALSAYVEKLSEWMTDPDASERPGES
jgi:hypothetical protein